MEIGQRIRQIRIHQGLTQTELIKGICSNTYISKIESGKTKPSYLFILKVAEVLNVDPEFLINENRTKIELEIHNIYEDYLQTEVISSQELALLILHSKELHSTKTLVKLYYVLISHYINENIIEAKKHIEQAKNTISDNYVGAGNELALYFNCLSKYFHFTKNYSEALFYADLHIKSLSKEGGHLPEAKAYFNLSSIRTKMDEDLELARLYSKKALHIFKVENFKLGIGYTLTELAIQYHRNGMYTEALRTLDELRTFSQNYQKEFYAPILEYNYGRVYQKLKVFNKAIEHLHTSINLDKRSGEENTIYALKCLAEISIEQKNWGEANIYLQRGFYLTSTYHLPNMHIHLLHLRSQIYKTRFDFSAYENEMKQAVLLAQEGKFPILLKEISKELADYFTEARAYKMATKYYQIAFN